MDIQKKKNNSRDQKYGNTKNAINGVIGKLIFVEDERQFNEESCQHMMWKQTSIYKR